MIKNDIHTQLYYGNVKRIKQCLIYNLKKYAPSSGIKSELKVADSRLSLPDFMQKQLLIEP